MRFSREQSARIALMVGLVVCLLAVTLIRIHDLDFGFYLATGRYIFHHGIPKTEFYLPLLRNEPWSSFWVIGALLLSGTWILAGPAGLVVLKALGYGGAFGLVAAAGRKRGAPLWVAVAVAAAGACALSPRFVARPGLASAFLVGGLGWTFASPTIADRIRRRPWIFGTVAVAVFAAWSWTHAEWYVGLFAFAILLKSKKLPATIYIPYLLFCILVPLVTHAILQPAGVRPVLSPFLIPLGGSAEFNIAEYTMKSWLTMPLAPVALLAVLASAVWLWTKKRRWEAIMAGALALLCIKVTRMALPATILGMPFVAEAIANRFRFVKPLTPRRAILTGALIALAGVATTAFTPFLDFGFRLDPILDVRGVGHALDKVPKPVGPVLAGFGWSSLLLSQPSVVRQGVIMDGRQEAYSKSYYENIYQPLFRLDAGWPKRARTDGIAFYFEPWSGGYTSVGVPRLMSALRERGWQLIAWDNAGRLAAKPELAASLGLRVLQFDPDDLEGVLNNPAQLRAAESEIEHQCERLEIAGLPSARGRIVFARLATRIGDLEGAARSLETARSQGGERFLRYWIALSEYATAESDWATAKNAERVVEKRGQPSTANALRAQAALRKGDKAAAIRYLERAARDASPEEARRYHTIVEQLQKRASSPAGSSNPAR